MRLPVVLDPDAQTEFDEAFDWYEGQRPGLGVTFTELVQDTFDRIAANPRMHGVVLRDVRKAVVARRWPYCVYYRVEPACVRIVAVFHTSRDPSVWKGRV